MKVVTGKSKPKAAPQHKGRRASRMSIERAENGLMVTTHHDQKGKSKAQMMGDYEPPEKKIITSHKDMMDHMMEKFGDVVPGGATTAGGSDHGEAETLEDTPKME